MEEKQKSGRKRFYEYYCPRNENHTALMFKNKHLCQQCTTQMGKNSYMHKRCKYCKQLMKNSEKHYYECESNPKNIKKPQKMVQQYQKPIQHSPELRISPSHPILPKETKIEVLKFTVPIPIEDSAITLDEAFYWYEEAKMKLGNPREIENCQKKMEFIVNNLQKHHGNELIESVIIQATLSNCYWVRGNHLKGNELLQYCIGKSLEFNLGEQWLIWVQWFAVRELNVGNFKAAEGILLPVIMKMNQNDEKYSNNTGLKASYFNNFGMSLIGQETKESFEMGERYFKAAIDLSPNEPIFVHNLSDLYKKFFMFFNQQDCLEISRRNAETIQEAQNMTLSTRFLLKNNLAEIYFLEGKFQKSLNIIENAIVTASIEDYLEESPVARLLETKAKVLLAQDKKFESLNEIDSAISIGKLKMIGSYHLKRFENFRNSIVESTELTPITLDIESDFGLSTESLSIPFFGQSLIFDELDNLIQPLNNEIKQDDENDDLNFLEFDEFEF
eukprot:gene5937-9767_t